MTPKCHRVIKGRLDLLYDPKGHDELCVSLSLFMNPKGHGAIRGRRDLLYDPKVQGDLSVIPRKTEFSENCMSPTPQPNIEKNVILIQMFLFLNSDVTL